jgi:uncharacterized membrane protein (UPF0182 family)
VQPVDPYYIMWQVPGTNKQQFVLMLPFTPKNRQVLIGWIAGMCDPENYGPFTKAIRISLEQFLTGYGLILLRLNLIHSTAVN